RQASVTISRRTVRVFKRHGRTFPYSLDAPREPARKAAHAAVPVQLVSVAARSRQQYLRTRSA
ncbi:hypothetical protein ACFFYR_19675, partial [Paraburkholderia dipogonis]|uniref:hypothetical protein n=1 Tax=Paraburkholderia dipogonis TaxID=1211383 RepID=UPI0035E4BED9